MTIGNPDAPRRIESIFSVVADAYANTPGNTTIVEEESIEQVLAAESDGCLADEMPSHRDLQRAYILKQLRLIRNGNQRRLKKVATNQQSILDLGADYEQVITVCSRKTLIAHGEEEVGAGRCTTLGNLSANDWLLMDLEQDIKFKEMARARMIFRGVVARDLPTWQKYANYRQLREQAGEESA